MLLEKYLRNVPLPEGLTQKNIFDALQGTQELFKMIRESTRLNLSTIVQSNNFSGMVSNVFTKTLSDISIYHIGNERTYPDLLHKSKPVGLEVKATKKPFKGGEGHNGHSGWHIIICYKIFSNDDIEFIQAQIAELIGYECDNSDWKYLGSRRNLNNSQRTETYVTNNIGTAKLRDGTVYLNVDEIKITPQLKKNREKLSFVLPIPNYSPFS